MKNRILKFNNPVFNPLNEYNITVRRGTKWAGVNNRDHNTSLEDGSPISILWSTTYPSVMYIPQNILKHEHDPSCKKREYLIKELKKLYKDFKVDEPVTVIAFSLL